MGMQPNCQVGGRWVSVEWRDGQEESKDACDVPWQLVCSQQVTVEQSVLHIPISLHPPVVNLSLFAFTFLSVNAFWLCMVFSILHSITLFCSPFFIFFWYTFKSVFSPLSPHFSFLCLPVFTPSLCGPFFLPPSPFLSHSISLSFSTSISPPSSNTCLLLKSQQCLKKISIDNWPAEQGWTCHLYPS